MASHDTPGDELDLPVHLGPQQRLLRMGAHTLTDAELLAVLLHGELVGERALAHAERLLRTVGGVPGLGRSHPEALVRLPGLGQRTVARLVAALALPARRDPFGQVTVTCVDDYAPVFRPVLAGSRHERLAVAVCDRGNRVATVRIVAEGTSDSAPLPLRDIIATVLRHDGHAFAIAHNHPSGNPNPSQTDRHATIRCRHAAELAGLDLNRPGFRAHLPSWEGWRDAEQVRQGDPGEGGPVGSGACQRLRV